MEEFYDYEGIHPRKGSEFRRTWETNNYFAFLRLSWACEVPLTRGRNCFWPTNRTQSDQKIRAKAPETLGSSRSPSGDLAETIHKEESFAPREPFERRLPDTLELTRLPFCPWGRPLPVVSCREERFFCTGLRRARETHSCLRNRQLSAPTYSQRSPPTELAIEFSNPQKGFCVSTSCSGRSSTARIFAHRTWVETDETHPDSLVS